MMWTNALCEHQNEDMDVLEHLYPTSNIRDLAEIDRGRDRSFIVRAAKIQTAQLQRT
tara:strand:+ start:392 stop:562 length:171 start_codon:yes stop_codon:yes gene_type:complete